MSISPRKSVLIVASLLLIACLCSPLSQTGEHSPANNQVEENESESTPANTATITNNTNGLILTKDVTYDVKETIRIINKGRTGIVSSLILKAALIHTIQPYQELVSMEISDPNSRITSDEHENSFAEVEYTDIGPGQSIEFEATYRVVVHGLRFDLGTCQGELPGLYISSEPYIQSDAVDIINLAETLARDKNTACDKVRSFYDYIGDNFTYAGYNPGSNGALQALAEKGGDCTEFSDAMVALCRAVSIPARFLEGVTCCTENGFSEGDNKHNWLEVYLPGSGWVPMDPTWGRRPSARDDFFGALPADHIIVTSGRNLGNLDNYHYYSYQYWWDENRSEPQLVAEENWSILRGE